ncbi:MAG: hypothetical protein Q8J84_08140 [Flavobacteriaceae bacterium]|nr:hypothetical protein [Flavobacteriaceae bacterium]
MAASFHDRGSKNKKLQEIVALFLLDKAADYQKINSPFYRFFYTIKTLILSINSLKKGHKSIASKNKKVADVFYIISY